MSTTVLPEIIYPSSDGQPMAETPLHMRVMIDLIETLNQWFKDDPNVWVWGNLFLYYQKGDPRKNVSPDVMVVKGVPKDRDRDTYKIWEEGKGPALVIEVTSPKTIANDVEDKFLLYRDVLQVPEYFLFDPRGENLDPPLRGYRLQGGEYQAIAEVDGRWPSEVLGLHLERHEWALRCFDPKVGKWLPTPEETAVAKRRADEKLQRETALRQQAESDNERLRRELEALRRQLPPPT